MQPMIRIKSNFQDLHLWLINTIYQWKIIRGKGGSMKLAQNGYKLYNW